MMDLILKITVIAASGCVLLSLGLAIYFFRHRAQRIGRAVGFMLVCEAIGMSVVAGFGLMEYLGVLENLPAEGATAIRWVAILATASSSIHLTHQLRKVIDE